MTDPYKMYSMHVNTSKESWVVYFMQMTVKLWQEFETQRFTNRPTDRQLTLSILTSYFISLGVK